MNSGTDPACRIDVDDTPTWVETPARQGDAAGRARDNACATLLPTGQVLVTGGWPGNAGAADTSTATRDPELYTPGIDWGNGDFSNGDEEEWVTIDEPAPSRRGYHSTALLLPHGRSSWNHLRCRSISRRQRRRLPPRRWHRTGSTPTNSPSTGATYPGTP